MLTGLAGLLVLIMLFEAGKSFYKAQYAFFRYKPVHSRVVPDATVTMTAPLEEMDFMLDTLGFERIGLLEVKVQIANQPGYEWVYRSEDGTIYAEMVQIDPTQPVLVQFASCFPDHAMIITRYPMGERVMTPDYQSRFAVGSVEAALAYQQQQLDDWRLVHGKPLTTNTVEDTERYDGIWREQHRRKDFRRIAITHLASGTVALLTGLLVGVDALMLERSGGLFSYTPFSGLLLPVMLGINFFILQRADKANTRADRAVDAPQLKKKKRLI